MAKSALVAIANGTEDLEAVAIIDVLRRAGIDVTVGAVGDDLTVVMAHKTKITADKLIKDVSSSIFDLIVLPGGIPGANNLANDENLTNMLHKQKTEGRHIGAICASPAVVLQDKKLYGDDHEHEMVAYPSFMEKIHKRGSTKVCVSKNLVTSIGPGTALDFSFKLVEIIVSAEKAKQLREGMMAECSHTDHKFHF